MKGYWVVLFFPPLLSTVNGWIWGCVSELGSCERRSSANNSSDTFYPSLEICRLVCGANGNIWPLPTKYAVSNKGFIYVDGTNATFTMSAPNNDSTSFLQEVAIYFKNAVNLNNRQNCGGNVYKFVIHLISEEPTLKLNWDTVEEYDLQITTDDSTQTTIVTIRGETVFGVRHGIESLLQLIEVYNVDEQICYVTLKGLSIQDKPFYKHRGLLLDSARNYLSVGVIKKNIVAMAMSKMNVLHWHLTDTQSFPFVSSRLPNMSRYGAYNPTEIYKPHQIKHLIQFAKLHGVRIIPEIDGPAHAGNGWQWGPDAGLGNLIVCYNEQPYRSYCIQPPCGQLNPANSHLYKVLNNLYEDIIDLWTESDVFHMGGDEVFVPCWNSSKEILDYINTSNRSEEVFLKLWAEFQKKAVEAYDLANYNASSSIILWTSSLTDPKYIESYLPKDRYVIQTWVPSSESLPQDLIKLGYKLIISTKDSWYLDHGFWGTTSYYTWRNIYNNTIPTDSAVLGGEVCMWGELVDDNNIEAKVWPRAAAAAERLWTNPTGNSVAATSRFFSHNDRLAKRGIKTSPVVPEFCSQSDVDCTGYLTL